MFPNKGLARPSGTTSNFTSQAFCLHNVCLEHIHSTPTNYLSAWNIVIQPRQTISLILLLTQRGGGGWVVSVTGLQSRGWKIVGSNPGVVESDGQWYTSYEFIMFKFNPMFVCVHSFLRFVLIKLLQHCGHLALSSCLMFCAKHYIMCGCIEGLCVKA